jgi:hypothetical protein
MKDLILLLSQLAQHAWIKYALEITLLTLGAGVLRVVTLRLFKRWTVHLNWKHKHFLVALVERMITPILVIAVVSAAFNLFPLSGRFLTVLSRSFYIAVLAIGILLRGKSCADSLEPVDCARESWHISYGGMDHARRWQCGHRIGLAGHALKFLCRRLSPVGPPCEAR